MAKIIGVDYALAAAMHLQREAAELTAAIEWNRDPREIGEEIADVFILAAAIADRLGVDVAAAIWSKLETLKARKWGLPDGEGVIEHVRE
jgi:NTP pyrophosphatase (non-canonical NTP hydrolase)